ncbi:hypothetical protein, partial [Marinospirillum sp.]|uniref:hypothetical protein n=1 Tax=Marinospirillum sp. TaxID=2183934 RepID=UPI003A8C623E
MKAENLTLSVLLALGVHLLALGLLVWNGISPRPLPQPETQQIIRAQVVDQDPAVRRAAEQERLRQQELQRQREAEQARLREQRRQEEARRQQQEAERQAAEARRQ